MKRYVKEFANEFLNVPKYPEAEKQKIQEIINYAEKGMITSMEAIKAILRIDEELQMRHAELEKQLHEENL